MNVSFVQAYTVPRTLPHHLTQDVFVADRAVIERLLHRRRVDPKENSRATASMSDRRLRLRGSGCLGWLSLAAAYSP